MNTGLKKISISLIVAILMTILAGCDGKSKTRPAPEFQLEMYFAELASVSASGHTLRSGQPPADRNELFELLKKRAQDDVLLMRKFVEKNGAEGLEYFVENGRYFMFVRKQFAHDGAPSFICASSGKGVYWLAASDEAMLVKQLKQ